MIIPSPCGSFVSGLFSIYSMFSRFTPVDVPFLPSVGIPAQKKNNIFFKKRYLSRCFGLAGIYFQCFSSIFSLFISFIYFPKYFPIFFPHLFPDLFPNVFPYLFP